MGTRHAEIAPSPRGSRRVSMSGRPRAHHLCPFPSRKRKPPNKSPRTPPQPTMTTAADDYHHSDGFVMPDVLAKGREACYKVHPSAPCLRSSAAPPKLSAPLRLSATDGATRSALRPFSAGTGCLLRVHREARGQKAHRDRHHGSPLPRRLQKVPRRLRQQLPPHLGKRPSGPPRRRHRLDLHDFACFMHSLRFVAIGESAGQALRPAVLRQEAGAEVARRRWGPPGPHVAAPALHLQAIGSLPVVQILVFSSIGSVLRWCLDAIVLVSGFVSFSWMHM